MKFNTLLKPLRSGKIMFLILTGLTFTYAQAMEIDEDLSMSMIIELKKKIDNIPSEVKKISSMRDDLENYLKFENISAEVVIVIKNLNIKLFDKIDLLEKEFGTNVLRKFLEKESNYKPKLEIDEETLKDLSQEQKEILLNEAKEAQRKKIEQFIEDFTPQFKELTDEHNHILELDKATTQKLESFNVIQKKTSPTVPSKHKRIKSEIIKNQLSIKEQRKKLEEGKKALEEKKEKLAIEKMKLLEESKKPKYEEIIDLDEIERNFQEQQESNMLKKEKEKLEQEKEALEKDKKELELQKQKNMEQPETKEEKPEKSESKEIVDVVIGRGNEIQQPEEQKNTQNLESNINKQIKGTATEKDSKLNVFEALKLRKRKENLETRRTECESDSYQKAQAITELLEMQDDKLFALTDLQIEKKIDPNYQEVGVTKSNFVPGDQGNEEVSLENRGENLGDIYKMIKEVIELKNNLDKFEEDDSSLKRDWDKKNIKRDWNKKK